MTNKETEEDETAGHCHPHPSSLPSRESKEWTNLKEERRVTNVLDEYTALTVRTSSSRIPQSGANWVKIESVHGLLQALMSERLKARKEHRL